MYSGTWTSSLDGLGVVVVVVGGAALELVAVPDLKRYQCARSQAGGDESMIFDFDASEVQQT